MQQNALTVIVPIKSQEVESLRTLLTKIGNDIEENPHFHFHQTPATHFTRMVILENDSKLGSRLLFTSNYDGTFKSYMQELVQQVGAEMEEIWNKCQGYSSGTSLDVKGFAEFIKRYSIKSQAFYIALPGVTVENIVNISRSRQFIDHLFDNQEAATWLGNLYQILPNTSKITVKPLISSPNPQINNNSSKPQQSFLERTIQSIIGIKPEVKNPNKRMTAAKEQVAVEDRVVQNQMTVIVAIKPNILSHILLRLILKLAAQAIKGSYGSLSGLTTIHFARWAIIDNGKNLLFESNFDGSWENYIDDFVDSASFGMNAIWGNCVGFPIGGCHDIEWFKEYIRKHQIPAEVFYSAYPETTLKNVLNDLNICKATEQYLYKKEVKEFLTGYYSSPI